MSYILDALKRADTERERGAAPGLHTRHQMPAGNADTPGERRLVWMAAAAGLTLLVLATTFWLWRTPYAPPAAALTPTASAVQTPAAPATVIPSKPRAAITPLAPVPIVVTEAPVAKAKPAEKANPKTVTVTAPPVVPAVPTTPTRAVAVTSPAAPAGTAASASTAAQAATLLSELPAELRNQIPKITITGSVYSDSPAQRLLLVNNLVLSQGGQVTPDLKLEEIQPRSSVFSYKGSRFRVMH
ncbi:general secretion pathway protein GspB [Rhodoferax sp.]|uniref:general secretion pathway protein GspB n=1 Tax=Rhodoferax sp. TaxID=50421 RepID=UPI0019E93F05|nr:general secretion pathway protein GspB [Rhodoferax sp.]MBE0474400.1 general secretion pathway protein GspB [Rhodoferax sp.]